MERTGTDAEFAAREDEVQAHVAGGRVEEAEQLCSELMRDFADNARAYFRVGKIYYLQKRFEESAAVLRRGLELDPGEKFLTMNLARALLKTQAPKEAAALLQPLQDQDDDVRVLKLLHRCYLDLRDWIRLDQVGERLSGTLPPPEHLHTHVVVCGFSRSGTTLLYNMMRGSVEDATCPPREISGLTFKEVDGDVITKRPLDAFNLDELSARFKDRRLKVVLVVRDCRSLLTSQHKRVPEQGFQGYDHSFFLAHESSYSNPGLIATNAAITSFLRSHPQLCHVVRFEDLVRDPEQVRSQLETFTGLSFLRPFSDFWKQDVPEALQGPLNGVRPIEADRAASWATPEGLARVSRQFLLAPQLQQLLLDWGYEQDGDWLKHLPRPSLESARGLIVVDARFAAEMARDAEGLGLVVEFASDWTGPAVAQGLGKLVRLRERRRGPLLLIATRCRIANDPWPYLSQYEADVAYYTARNGEPRPEVLWLNDSPGAAAFLEAWERVRRANPEASAVKQMQTLLAERESGVTPFSIQHLPPSMCPAVEEKLPSPPVDRFLVRPPA